MAKTREVYPTVGKLRLWLGDSACGSFYRRIPDNWIVRSTEYGFRADPPDGMISGDAFSLVPEDEEVRDDRNE